ncbi:hypothetical protein TNCV_1371121 [Trichonephila clavipes]|nr:hypothetical protein TNCV_1371121 [Trichonephila clavipes]
MAIVLDEMDLSPPHSRPTTPNSGVMTEETPCQRLVLLTSTVSPPHEMDTSRQTAKRVLLENPSFQINLENRFSLPTTVNSSEFPALPTLQQTTAQQNAQAGVTTSSSTAANMNTNQTGVTPSSQKPRLTNTSTQ